MNIRFLIIFIAFFTTSSAEKGQSCTTPDNKTGKCVSIYDCKALINLITAKNESDIVEFARKSQCGFDAPILVCCEISELPVATKHENTFPDVDNCGTVLDNSIVSGDTTHLNEYPWVAALEYKNRKTGGNAEIECVGFLINKKYVLTAASCLMNKEHELIHVRLGEWNLISDPDCESTLYNEECAKPVHVVNISKVIPHPLYNNSVGNNIGLIKLTDDVEYTEFVNPICLPFTNQPSSHNYPLVTAGWGKITQGTQFNVLKHDYFHTLPLDDCKDKIGNNILKDVSNILCGIPGRKGPLCNGSVGSPIMRKRENGSRGSNWYAEGIFMWSHECDTGTDHIVIYTSVLDFLPWIISTVSEA